MTLTHINPPTLHTNPAFSQGVLVPAGQALLFVGGQNGVDGEGEMVGDDLAAQTGQALRNVLDVLAAAGADQRDVASMSILIIAGQDIAAGYAATLEVWGQQPTSVTFAHVAGLARPDALVEIAAVAAVPSA